MMILIFLISVECIYDSDRDAYWCESNGAHCSGRGDPCGDPKRKCPKGEFCIYAGAGGKWVKRTGKSGTRG